MPILEGQVLWPSDAPRAGDALTLTVELRDVGRQDAAAPLVARFVTLVHAPVQGDASAFYLDWADPAGLHGEPAPDLALQARAVDASGTLRFISTEHVSAARGARVKLQHID